MRSCLGFVGASKSLRQEQHLASLVPHSISWLYEQGLATIPCYIHILYISNNMHKKQWLDTNETVYMNHRTQLMGVAIGLQFSTNLT